MKVWLGKVAQDYESLQNLVVQLINMLRKTGWVRWFQERCEKLQNLGSKGQEDHQDQLDVKTVFLYGDLDEEIFMSQPTGFKTQGKEENGVQFKEIALWAKRIAKAVV